MTPSDTSDEDESVMAYTRVSADAHGESHFIDEQVALDEADIAPPAPPVNMSSPTPAENVAFVTLPAGWPEAVDEPHVAPARNYWFVLSGEMEVTAGDGETRQFKPGGILLAEDTTGTGHTTTVVSDSPVELAVVGIPE
jgi:quercetin dioxygenase-like cupin family protein